MMRENKSTGVPTASPENQINPNTLNTYDGPDGRDTERGLVEQVAQNPEIGGVQPSTGDDVMKKALENYKAEQDAQVDLEQKRKEMNQVWDQKAQIDSNHQTALAKKSERLEKRADVSSTSRLAQTQHFAQEKLTGNALAAKNKEVEAAWNQPANNPDLEGKLMKIQEALAIAGPHADPEVVQALEKQESDLIAQVNKQRENGVPLAGQIVTGAKNIETQQKWHRDKRFQEGMSKLEAEDVPFEEISDKETSGLPENIQEKSVVPVGKETIEKLRDLGFNPDQYDAIIKEVPDFELMSEGRRSYILQKVNEQSLEHIDEVGQQKFKESMQEAGFWKKTFQKGKLRREAMRQAKNDVRGGGVSAMLDDLKQMTKHVKDAGFEVVLDDKEGYRIQYLSEEQMPDEKMRLAYNRAATAFSEVPYEWGFDTATKKQQRAFDSALQAFEKTHEDLKKNFSQDVFKDKIQEEEAHQKLFALKSQVELNQFFSSNPDVETALQDIENATGWSDTFKKAAKGGLPFMGGTATRLLSKSLWGLGGAAGASAIVSGFMAFRRKNTEFKKDAVAARRGGEQKKTTDKVFDAKKNTDRIHKLIEQFHKSPSYDRQNKTLAALENRIQLLDERMREGRVNFGKGADQFKNKHDLINAMSEAMAFRYEVLNQDSQDIVPKRILQYFETQDKKSKTSRRAERTKAVASAATIGAVGAAGGWLAVDIAKGGETSQHIFSWLKSVGQEVKEGASAWAGVDLGVGNIDTSGGQINTPEVPTVDNGGDSSIPNQPDNSTLENSNFDVMGPPSYDYDQASNAGLGNSDVMGPPSYDYGQATNLESGNPAVKVEASSRGAIQTFADLQEQLQKQYNGNFSRAPQSIKDFMSKTPTELATEEGMFRPDEVNESAKIYKGDTLGFTEDGRLVYEGSRSGTVDLTGDNKFTGEHFDYGAQSTDKTREVLDQVYDQDAGRPVNPNTGEPIPDLPGVDNETQAPAEGLSQEQSTDNIFQDQSNLETDSESVSTQDNPNMEAGVNTPEGYTHLKLFDGLELDYALVEDPNGKPEVKFSNFDLRKFDAYHESYFARGIQKDGISLKEYVDQMYEKSTFAQGNDMSKVQAQLELRQILNQMIMRDQVLQEGGLDSKSELYKTLKNERNFLKRLIKNNFEFYGGRLVGSFGGSHYPDPNYVASLAAEQNPISSGEGVTEATKNTESGPQVFGGEKPDTESSLDGGQGADGVDNVSEEKNLTDSSVSGIETVREKSTDIVSNPTFEITRDDNGAIEKITARADNVLIDKVSLQDYGIKDDWLPQLTSNESRILRLKVDRLKANIALRDVFTPNTPEYNYYSNQIETYLNILKRDNPEIFKSK